MNKNPATIYGHITNLAKNNYILYTPQVGRTPSQISLNKSGNENSKTKTEEIPKPKPITKTKTEEFPKPKPKINTLTRGVSGDPEAVKNHILQEKLKIVKDYPNFIIPNKNALSTENQHLKTELKGKQYQIDQLTCEKEAFLQTIENLKNQIERMDLQLDSIKKPSHLSFSQFSNYIMSKARKSSRKSTNAYRIDEIAFRRSDLKGTYHMCLLYVDLMLNNHNTPIDVIL